MVIRAVVLTFLLSLLLATPTSGQFASWAFEAPIVVQSVNEDAALTNHWVAIERVDPRALHTQSFMRSDAADLRMATALGEEIPVFAQGLNSEDVTWWFRAPIISRHPTTYFMQLGNPTASNSQSLGLAERDMVVVRDDVSLDITESLMLESDGTRVDELVDETTWLIQKPGAYGLGIRPSGNALEVFGEIVTGDSASVVTDHTAASVPTAKGSLTSPSVETEGCADASKYNCVDDPVGVPDVETYLHTADGSSNTVHTGSALPEGNGARASSRIVANGCTSTSKWQCVNDATNRPDTSTYLSTVDNSTDVDDEEDMRPNSNGDRASTSISTRGCTAGSKWQCVDDPVNNPDNATSYLFTEGLVTADSLPMFPDSNGDETNTSLRARGCSSRSKWDCVDDPANTPDTSTYLYTSGFNTSGSGTMRPDGQATTDSDMAASNDCVSQRDKYRCIDDPVGNPDDTDYLSAGVDTGSERYTLTSLTVPSNARVTDISTRVRYRGGSSQGTRCRVQTWLRTGGSDTTAQGLSDNWIPRTWNEISGRWSREPDGTTWDVSDLENLQVGLTLNFTRAGSGTCHASQLYVTVRYSLSVSNAVKTASFNLGTPPSIPSGASITHVTTRFRFNDNNSTVGTCEISAKLRLNSTDLVNVANVNANPSAWENVTGNATAKPGGGPWAVTDLANLQVGLSMRTLGGTSSTQCWVTQLYIVVHYSGASTPVNTISFGLSNPTTIPDGATIAKIETHFRYSDASLPNGTCEISASLRINGREPSNPVASVNSNPSGWTSASGASRAKPRGSAWTQADLNSLQVVLAMRVLGGNASSQCQVTQLYAVVDFRENTTDTAIHEISFAIGNPTIPVNATIQNVVTHFRYDHSGSGTGSCRIWSTLRLRSSTLSSVSSVSARPARWTDVEGEATTKPGGGVWLRTDIPALEVGLRMKTVGAGTCKVTQVYAVVHYRVSVTDTAVHAINFGMSVPAMPVNASIQKVATHFRYTSAGATSGVCNINSTLHLRGSTLSAVSSVSARPTTWTDVGGESTERPGGGEWTTADLGDLELGLRMRAIGIGLICRVTQMNATIHYTITTVAGATKEVISYAPLSLGATYDLAFVNYRGELKLRVDGVEEVVAKTAPDAIPVSGEDLVVGGGWKGAIGRTRVSEVGVIPYQYADGTGNGNSALVGFFTEPLAATHRGAFAPFDQYLSFPGVANALDVSNFNGAPTPIDNIFAGGGTVEFCAQPPSDPTSTSIIRPISKTDWGVLYQPGADAMNFVFMHGYATEKGEWAFPSSPTQDGEWHCYAAAFDRDQAPDTVALYIDGQPVTATIRSTRSGAPLDDSGDRFRFGTTTSVEYAGGLDEIRLWDDIRTADEVAANWNTPVADPRNAGGLVGYWPLDDRADNEIRLDLQYQAPHTTETQKGTEDNAWNWLGVVDDQSSFGNDAAYSFLRDTSTSAVTKGGLAIRNPTQPVGLGIPNPGRVVQPLVDDDIGTGDSPAFNVPIFGLLVSVFADVANVDYTLIWTVVILGMAVVVLIGMVSVTGEPVSAMFAAGLVLAFGAMIDVLSWIVLILYVILSVGLAAILLRRP